MFNYEDQRIYKVEIKLTVNLILCTLNSQFTNEHCGI